MKVTIRRGEPDIVGEVWGDGGIPREKGVNMAGKVSPPMTQTGSRRWRGFQIQKKNSIIKNTGRRGCDFEKENPTNIDSLKNWVSGEEKTVVHTKHCHYSFSTILQKRMRTDIDVYTDQEQIARDLDTIKKRYVKERLFLRVKFLYDSSTALKKEGRIHRDYIRYWVKEGGLGGSYQFVNPTAVARYYNFLWDKIVDGRLYEKWLSDRRSAVYTVMRHKFAGKSGGGRVTTWSV